MNRLFTFILLIATVQFSVNAAPAGTTAQPITAETINGQAVNFDPQVMNKPLVLLFSDSLCPYPHLPSCEEEITEFNRLVAKYGDKVQWLQVVKGYYVGLKDVKAYVKHFAITVPTVWDTPNQIFKDYGVFANPYALVVNQRGEISYRQDDFIGGLDQYLKTLL